MGEIKELVDRLRIGTPENPEYEVVWVQNLRAHFKEGMFSRQFFPEWNDIFLANVNALLAASTEAADALTSLMEERDDLAEIAAKYRVVCNDRDSWRRTAEKCKSEADAITSLIAERDGLREALKPFAALGEHAAWMEKPDDKGAWVFDDAVLTWGDFRMARKIFGEP